MKFRLTISMLALTMGSGLAQTTTELAPTQKPTLLELLQAGGITMGFLGILSVIASCLILIFFFTLTKRAIVTDDFMETASHRIKKGDLLGLVAIANRHREAVADVAKVMLDFASTHREASFEAIKEVAETRGAHHASALNQRVTLLADFAAIAPMLGLLGTVVGMIESFALLANDMTASRGLALGDAVSKALVTTGAGLVISIICLFAYSHFRSKSQKLIAELEMASTELLAILSIHYHNIRPTLRSEGQNDLKDDSF